jgi:FkbM family methyltransferase
MIRSFEYFLAHHLPGESLKDLFPRAMRRFAEYGLFKGSVIVRTKYDFLFKADRLDAVKWFVYYFGQLEPVISRAWFKLLKRGDFVIDIGGNVGYHALLASSCVGVEGGVVSFEPSTRIFSEQLDNINLNNRDNIRSLKLAVSNHVGEVDLYFAGENIQGNSSIVNQHKDAPVEKVKCISFQEICELVDLKKVKIIKIDVEGAEHLVLDGLHKIIEALPISAVIFLEISPENTEITESMLAPFAQCGFLFRKIDNEYSTKFYRTSNSVVLRPFEISAHQVNDIVMCRDEKQFQLMED